MLGGISDIIISFAIISSIIALWILSVWFSYKKGYGKGYSNCMNFIRQRKKTERKNRNKKLNNDIRVMPSDLTEHSEVENVRVIGRRPHIFDDYQEI